MTALDQLLGLQRLVAPAGVWVPGYSFGAYDVEGRQCPCRAPEAVRFGLLGGLVRLGGGLDERQRAVDLLRAAVGAKHLCTWEQEPGRTEAEARDAVARAVALAENGGRP